MQKQNLQTKSKASTFSNAHFKFKYFLFPPKLLTFPNVIFPQLTSAYKN